MTAYYLAVDLGGTRVRTAVVDSFGALLGRREEPTDHSRGPDGVIHQIARLARGSMTAAGVSTEIRQLVIGAPGPLDSGRGIVFNPPNMPGWEEVYLRDELERALSIPVTVENDANAAAMGEYVYGSGRGTQNFVYITISTGIGGGVIADGRLLRGTHGTAGEIGHMTIDRHGPICKCGNVGCLEMLASGTSIARIFRERLAAGETSALRLPFQKSRPTAEDVVGAAEAGDPLASAVLEDAAMAVGTGVVNVIHLFNPEVVALGGGVTNAGPLLFDVVRATVDRYAMPVPREGVRIVPAELGDDAGLMGTAAIAIAMDRERAPGEVAPGAHRPAGA